MRPNEQRAITAKQSETRRRMSQGDAELMAEQQILSLKPAPRLEQVGDEHSERMQDRKHRSQGCDDSALQCESRPDGIFGKDRLPPNSLRIRKGEFLALTGNWFSAIREHEGFFWKAETSMMALRVRESLWSHHPGLPRSTLGRPALGDFRPKDEFASRCDSWPDGIFGKDRSFKLPL
jgi:hypothetical protein